MRGTILFLHIAFMLCTYVIKCLFPKSHVKLPKYPWCLTASSDFMWGGIDLTPAFSMCEGIFVSCLSVTKWQLPKLTNLIRNYQTTLYGWILHITHTTHVYLYGQLWNFGFMIYGEFSCRPYVAIGFFFFPLIASNASFVKYLKCPL